MLYDFSQFSLNELIGYVFLGIFILVMAYRLVIWFIDTVVGGLFWQLVSFINNLPNRIKKDKGAKK